ncbi:MAG: response regulator [Lachnospiraceae bacterium]|nr:response regulator [Lachnospiraceae bacterium]
MRNKVLVVDDQEMNRDLLEEILIKDYDVVKAPDGKQALEKLGQKDMNIVAVLLDLLMPEMDGFAVLDAMHEQGMLKRIPVLVISSEQTVNVEEKCFDYGVSDFIRKPFEPSIIQRRVKNTVDLFLYKEHLEDRVAVQTQAIRNQYQLLKEQAEKLEKNNEEIIDILGTVVECRDLESGDHIKRVKTFTRILAEQVMEDYPEYGLTPEKVRVIESASALHDVGKIAIPDNILLKPGKLTAEEFEIMKTHTTRGSELLNNIKDAWDDTYGKYCYEICRYHHERFDGRGYPDKLEGEAIPISAQIVSVADVYDALVSKRVYKDAYAIGEAYDMIVNGECGTFPPKILACFAKVRAAFEETVRVNRESQQETE